MQKGRVLVFILVGILVLVGIMTGVFYLAEQGSVPALTPAFRSMKTVFSTKGSEEYCRQFGPSSSDCPSGCEVRPSCPICTDIGCHAKLTPIPSPTLLTTPIPTVIPTKTPSNQVCIQVITPAKDPKSGECREFSTPCDVPEGWEKVASCGTNSPIQLQ